MTRREHLSLLGGAPDPFEVRSADLLEQYLAALPPATDEIGEADNVARAHNFTIHEITPSATGLPPRLYVHTETSSALFWVAGTPTPEQTEFGRTMFLAGMAWGAGTAVDLYSLLRLHAVTGHVRHEAAATVTRWLQHYRKLGG